MRKCFKQPGNEENGCATCDVKAGSFLISLHTSNSLTISIS